MRTRRRRNPEFSIHRLDKDGKDYLFQLVASAAGFYNYLRLEYERSASSARNVVQEVVDNALKDEERNVKDIA